ncbi:MAG: hypothetical protein U0M06_09670 [Clostridia bacterium]|nr:hypothetical protein [Clostridia bacterium]
MATENKTENKNDYVELFVEPGYAKDDPNEFISINGKNYILPKGETSFVPPCVKAEYERARRARSIQKKNSDKLLGNTNKPIEL